MFKNNSSVAILHIVPYFKPAYIYGGPIVSINFLTDQLSQHNHKVSVWTTNANGNKILEIKPNTETKIEQIFVTYFSLFGTISLFFSPRLLTTLYKKIYTFDIVHIHTWWNLTALGAAFICLLKGIKPVLSPRGMLSYYSFGNRKSFFKKLFHTFFGKALLKNTILHATTKQEFEECRAIIPEWKGFIAPNIIHLKKIETSFTNSKEGVFNIIFLSRIHHKKGIELLFESLSKVNFKWQLFIVGKGDDLYLKTLKELTIDFKIDTCLEWLNWADGDKKFELLSDSDLMVLPSFNENFANTVLESLSVGTPVLVSNMSKKMILVG
jgi:glycosyltransferase involved in cell wall biosynthesis